MLRARDPATPIVPPPAPEVAVAAKPVPDDVVFAVCTSFEPATEAAGPTSALVETLARLMATAAPILAEPVGGARAAAEPSPVAATAAFDAATRLTTLPALIVKPLTEASVLELVMLIAMAAATVIGPSGVPGGGVGAMPEVPPVCAWPSAKLRSLPT